MTKDIIKENQELFNEIIELSNEIKTATNFIQKLEQEKLFEAEVLVLNHILCLSGCAGQVAASLSIIEKIGTKRAKLFITACTNKNGDYKDALKRMLIKNSGINHYFAEVITKVNKPRPSGQDE